MSNPSTKDYSQYSINCKPHDGPPPPTITFSPLALVTSPLPTSFSLRNKIPFIFDQSGYGSCVSNAVALYLAYLNVSYIPSRLFIYYNGRLLSGRNLDQDTGLSIFDGCNSVANYKPCQEPIWPYNGHNLFIKPSQLAYSSPIVLDNYNFMSVNNNIIDIKQAIFSGSPLIFAIKIYQSFYEANQTGIVPLPNVTTEKHKGGHCVLLVGYDDTKQLVTCVNSWGSDWGDDGFFTLPYAFLLDSNLAHDFYVLKISNTDIRTITPFTNIKCCSNCVIS
jgi:hypothetical protein